MNRLRRFFAARDGVAFIEMAFVAPFLILLFIGGYELVRYLVILQKVEKATYALANITAQYPPTTAEPADGQIDEEELRSNVFPQLQRIMDPYDDTSQYVAILTSIRKEDDDVLVKWQMGGGGSLGSVVSIVNQASPSDPPNISARNQVTSFESDLNDALATMLDNENMVIAEVFFAYTPVMQETLTSIGLNIEPVTVHRWLFLKPRNGDLICLPPSFYYSDCLADGGGPSGECSVASAPCENDHADIDAPDTWLICEKELISETPCLAHCEWANPPHTPECR